MYRTSTWKKCVFTAGTLLLAGTIVSEASAQTATITTDFGSRTVSSYPIPANLFGVGVGGGLHPGTLPLMTQGGLTYTRFHASMQDTFTNSTPDWSELDAKLSAIQAAGLNVILEMDYTPASLQPASSPCPAGTAAYHAAPTSVSGLAAMATAYVHHIDLYFPGVVTDYEIWNEPDGGGLCAGDNSQAAKLASYLQIFAAMAPAIQQAAAADGVQVNTGGPTLGSPIAHAPAWLGALLSNPSTAPFVNFVSFHYYVSGAGDVANGMTWDGSNGTPSLFAMTQSSRSIGMQNVYEEVAGLVSQGSQPNAANTPIYLDEYNSDWAFVNDCCRNSPTYSPVWNSVVFADLLNSVYDGAPQVPTKILYYSISNHPFCIAGVWDADMDCVYPSSGAPTPYPQYYALQLFASNSYLGLQNGGYMTPSPASASDPALLTTSFWNNAGDAIVITNPTGTDYTGVSIVANHPNVPFGQGTVDTINDSAVGITTQSINVFHTPTGYITSVDVPAYSVVAVTITPGLPFSSR